MGVPKNMMYINQSFRKYGIESSKVIDIVIHDMIDDEMKPVAIVECKSPGLALYHTTTAHIEDFAKKIGVNYLIVTNGNDVDSYISREDRLSFWKIDNIPDYETICNGHRAALATEFALHTDHKKKKSSRKIEAAPKFNSKTTPKVIQPVVMGLVKCLSDDRSKLKPQMIDKLNFVGDCGLRKKLMGFGSEKHHNPLARTLLVKDFYNNHQMVSVDITPDLSGTPYLSVTLDDYDSRQVIYALDLSESLREDSKKIQMMCDFQTALPQENMEFLQALRQFISEKAPALIKDNHLYFGELEGLVPFKMDQDEIAQVLAQLITFALLLDEYREQLKSATRDQKKSNKK
jgi:hypothetical protein